MSYYILSYACNTVETGSEYPQIQEMNNGYNYDSPDSISALSKARNKFPEFYPNLNSFQLHSRAKLTDLLSNSFNSFGMLISNRLKNILESHKIVSHKFFPAQVITKHNVIEKYYWMHIVSDLTDCVEYEKSKFFIYKDFSINLGDIHIASKEDFIRKREQLVKDNPSNSITIWAEKIIFNDFFDKELDFFEIGKFDSNYFISQRLQESIFENKITGCNIKIANIY